MFVLRTWIWQFACYNFRRLLSVVTPFSDFIVAPPSICWDSCSISSWWTIEGLGDLLAVSVRAFLADASPVDEQEHLEEKKGCFNISATVGLRERREREESVQVPVWPIGNLCALRCSRCWRHRRTKQNQKSDQGDKCRKQTRWLGLLKAQLLHIYTMKETI